MYIPLIHFVEKKQEKCKKKRSEVSEQKEKKIEKKLDGVVNSIDWHECGPFTYSFPVVYFSGLWSYLVLE